jgi:hypothetical protein
VKVRDVLAKIGDKPLVEALKARGYRVYEKGNTFDMAADLESEFAVFADGEEDKAAEWLRDNGYFVSDVLDMDALEQGFEHYRQRRADEFRRWLRSFFWEALGRIA